MTKLPLLLFLYNNSSSLLIKCASINYKEELVYVIIWWHNLIGGRVHGCFGPFNFLTVYIWRSSFISSKFRIRKLTLCSVSFFGTLIDIPTFEISTSSKETLARPSCEVVKPTRNPQLEGCLARSPLLLVWQKNLLARVKLHLKYNRKPMLLVFLHRRLEEERNVLHRRESFYDWPRFIASLGYREDHPLLC